MTRSQLRRRLAIVYTILGTTIGIAVASKAISYTAFDGSVFARILKDAYEVIGDTSLLLATLGVAYVGNLFQQRQNFSSAVVRKWNDISKMKSSVLQFIQKPYASQDDYIVAHLAVLEVIDNMRDLYKNTGETEELTGFFPYSQLNDIRRVLESVDPARLRNEADSRDLRLAARDAILASFYSLRESFFVEFDLPEAAAPVVAPGAGRKKVAGATKDAQRLRESQGKEFEDMGLASKAPRHLLLRLYQAELDRASGEQVAEKSGNATASVPVGQGS